MFGMPSEKLFDDAVFQRMKGDDGQPAAAFQTACRLRQRGRYFFKLAVDENPNGLKRPRRRVLSALASTDVLRRDLRQLAGCIDGIRAALRDNGARNLAGKPLFTIISDYLADFVFIRRSQPFGRRHAPRRIHPHIQGRVKAETESARAVVYLRRGNAQIEQCAVYLADIQSI